MGRDVDVLDRRKEVEKGMEAREKRHEEERLDNLIDSINESFPEFNNERNLDRLVEGLVNEALKVTPPAFRCLGEVIEYNNDFFDKVLDALESGVSKLGISNLALRMKSIRDVIFKDNGHPNKGFNFIPRFLMSVDLLTNNVSKGLYYDEEFVDGILDIIRDEPGGKEICISASCRTIKELYNIFEVMKGEEARDKEPAGAAGGRESYAAVVLRGRQGSDIWASTR